MWRKVLGIGTVVLLVGALVGGGAYIVLRDDGIRGTGLHAGRGGEGLGGLGNGGGAGRSGSGTGLALGNGGSGGRGGAGTGAGSGILGGGSGAYGGFGAGAAGAGVLSGDGGAGWAGRAGGKGGNWNAPGALDGSGADGKALGRETDAGAERAAAGDDRVWRTITGTVIVAGTDLVVEAADGATLTVSIGPAHARDVQGVALLPGDTVALLGFDNRDGTFVPSEIENLSSGGKLALRDASGRPLWSGRGRRGL